MAIRCPKPESERMGGGVGGVEGYEYLGLARTESSLPLMTKEALDRGPNFPSALPPFLRPRSASQNIHPGQRRLPQHPS